MTTNNVLPEIFPVSSHTDHIGKGSTFVAVKGLNEDGTKYISEALKRGATQIVVANDAVASAETEQQIATAHAKLTRVENTRRALAQLSAEAAGFPAKKLHLVAVTGTKGKTSTVFILEHILKKSGKKTALLSTAINKIGDREFTTKFSTQQPDYLHQFFKTCVSLGVEWLVMEVSAQALSLHRVEGIEFDAAIFTNFSLEHGEFYETQDAYFEAKKSLISHLKSGAPFVFNADDARVAGAIETYKHAIPFTSKHSFSCPQLIGEYNAYNIAAAATCAQALSVSKEIIAAALLDFPGVPGRLERYLLPNGAVAYVDYAHNPSSLEAVLTELRKHTKQLIVVFGAGGDRDPARRPIMGGIISKFADMFVVTSDNPRSEDPLQIAKQVAAGVNQRLVLEKTLFIETDRKKAIHFACKLAQKGSIVAVLGKGHETETIIKGVAYPFSDRQVLQELIDSRTADFPVKSNMA